MQFMVRQRTKRLFIVQCAQTHSAGNLFKQKFQSLFVVRYFFMRLIKPVRTERAYRFDLIFYAVSPLSLGLLLYIYSPLESRAEILLLGLVGLVLWSLIEYLLHRFVLHGLPPFKRWHTQHHNQPMARICLPTALSMLLILLLVFLPSLCVFNIWQASSFTCGVLSGYAIYTHIHHATHHARQTNGWLARRQREHAIHHASHHFSLQPKERNFGVTNQFWDRLFHTAAH
ncbi:sterol desaturase family protein [Limnohabitans sp. MORI2]|uniref:sterol desaturase family protein n=1 Tax=Limnohabitans sp. MORI2 TaxID=1751150 RepID=UPI0024912C78|nr:sterol desaturase family protein [Limnohabitans sp. MORI2]